jgi:hypothetical protein
MAGKAVMMNEEGKITPYRHPANEGRKWYRMHSYFQNKVNQTLNKK